MKADITIIHERLPYSYREYDPVKLEVVVKRGLVPEGKAFIEIRGVERQIFE